MYNILLNVHSYTRWIITILAIWVIIRAIMGLVNKSEYTNADGKTSLFFMISCDIQLLVGLLLYFVYSPITQAAFADFGAAMKDKETRFWAVEHITAMIISWILVHMGRAKSKKGTDAQRHRNSLIFYGLAIIIILATVQMAGRPLLR
jgi:Na+/H+-dicarboxylate symporter